MSTILHSIDTGGPGGAETVFVTLAAVDGPFHNIALAKPGGWVEQALHDRRVEAYFTNPSGSFNRAYLIAIIRMIREHDVRLIQSHLFGSNLYCAMAGTLCGVPVVSAFHGANDLAGAGMAQGFKRQLVQRGSAAMVAVSETLRRQLIRKGFSDSNKLRVVHNGVDIDRFVGVSKGGLRSELDIPPDAILIGAVGNVRRPKGYEVLVEAMEQLAPDLPRLHLVIAGHGGGKLFEILQAQIRDAGLEKRIHLLGFVADTPALFANLAAYVSSSHSEGFSLSCVEAMVSRTPVVATRSGGPEEILENERTGLLVPTRNPTALADALRRTLTEADATQNRVNAAWEVASVRFSSSAMVSGYAEIYHQLLTARGLG